MSSQERQEASSLAILFLMNYVARTSRIVLTLAERIRKSHNHDPTPRHIVLFVTTLPTSHHHHHHHHHHQQLNYRQAISA
jgi:hypothetical protein